ISSSTGPHSLQYLYSVITSEFTAVVLVDEEQIVYYGSNERKMIPKTEWIKTLEADDAQYWKRETQRMQNQQEWFQDSLEAVMQSFNQTEGVHTLQRRYGCKFDHHGATRGHDQCGYDGEDLMSLDLKSGTWTAANEDAEIFIKTWDPKGRQAKYWKNVLETDCTEWLQNFVFYGKETLERKVPPEMSLFQNHSRSPEVVCHATGFFPKALNISWQKDGEDVHEDVEVGETLPNQDGSFQKRSILKVSAEELQKHNYTCAIEHSSLEKDLVL
ncbi:major histocompatibility complex class I UIA precursor, partial [Silurus asotus]